MTEVGGIYPYRERQLGAGRGIKREPNGKLPQRVSTMLASNKEADRLIHRIGFQEQMRETKRVSSFVIFLRHFLSLRLWCFAYLSTKTPRKNPSLSLFKKKITCALDVTMRAQVHLMAVQGDLEVL